MKNRLYVTTAIDYVNAKPHVGHAVEKIQADVLARYYRQVLGSENVYFLTGSDDNALKNVQSAKKAGKDVREFVKENSESFRRMDKMLNVSFDQFIQTTEKRHFAGAQKLWDAFKKEDVEKKSYKGLYCVGCEEFKTEKDLIDGKCPDHQAVPEMIEEENWFFKLSNYQSRLEELVLTDQIKVIPEFRKNEVLGFIRRGLEDFSISRSANRAENWGVPVPGNPDQIMYVWVDALSNYITALGYADDDELFKKFWRENENRVHVIGKGILRFHAIYWPAMLLSAGLPVPTKILSHEYLTINGQKISKTLGNVINPDEVVEKFGVDGARYVLLSALPASRDGDISWEWMTEKFNADLANGIGNLTSRIVTLYQKTEKVFSAFRNLKSDRPDDTSIKNLESGEFAKELGEIMSLVQSLNQYIEMNKPWELAKKDNEEFVSVMEHLVLGLGEISKKLGPLMPETSQKIKQALETKKTDPLFQRIR